MRSEAAEQDGNCPSIRSVSRLLQRYSFLSAMLIVALYVSLTSSIFPEASPSELSFYIPRDNRRYTNDGNKSRWQCRACLRFSLGNTKTQKFWLLLYPESGTSPEVATDPWTREGSATKESKQVSQLLKHITFWGCFKLTTSLHREKES